MHPPRFHCMDSLIMIRKANPTQTGIQPELAHRHFAAPRLGVCLVASLALLLSACGKDDSATKANTIPPRSHAHQPASSAEAGSASAASKSRKRVVPASGEITIESDDRMRFDVSEFTVKPGQTVTLTLRHTGRMPVNVMGHDVVILKAGTDLAAFIREANRSAQSDHIPEALLPQVIAHTKMIGGGQSDTITFTAPAQTGDYDFICTFPAHANVGMQGKMLVRD